MAAKHCFLAKMEAKTQKNPEIVQAGLEDFEELKVLMRTANDYSLKLTGVPQWTAWDRAFGQLEGLLASGQVFIIRDNEGAIASSISYNFDSEYWGDITQDNNAIYFYKLMKDPQRSSADDAKQLLMFVAYEAIKSGKQYLRCDTLQELPKLIRYYEKIGFVQKGDFSIQSVGRRGVILEASAETVSANLAKMLHG